MLVPDEGRKAVWRRWSVQTPVEQAAQLFDLSETLEQRIRQGDMSHTMLDYIYPFFSSSERVGREILKEAGLPFSPAPLFPAKNEPTEVLLSETRQVAAWAESLLYPIKHGKECLYAAIDLRTAGRAVANAHDRSRGMFERG